jgi:uncharacterized phage infection (PIP) family protein YhgE
MRALVLTLFSLSLLLGEGQFLYADAIAELRGKIEERNRAIAELEREIAGYQEELSKTTKEAQTLQAAVRSIDLEQRKLSADISLTENRIAAATLAIEELSGTIYEKEEKIERGLAAMTRSLRLINQLESATLFESVLGRARLSEVWDDINALERLELEMRAELEAVRKVFTDSGSLAYSRQKALQYVNQAKKVIVKITPDKRLAKLLAYMADFLIERDR